MDDQNNWVTGKEELKGMAGKFYTNLFKSDPEAGGELIEGIFPALKEDNRRMLGARYTEEETKIALKGMRSLKAPGPDGFQAMFVKKTWEQTGPAVFAFAKGVLK